MIRSMLFDSLAHPFHNVIDTLFHSRRIIGQVQEQRDTLHTAILLKVSREESRRLQIDTHGTKHDGEVLLVTIVYILCGLADQTCLPTDLRCDFVVGETGGGEDGDFLAASDRVHGVDGGDTGGDHFFGVHLEYVSLMIEEWGCSKRTLEYGLMGEPLMSR